MKTKVRTRTEQKDAEQFPVRVQIGNQVTWPFESYYEAICWLCGDSRKAGNPAKLTEIDATVNVKVFEYRVDNPHRWFALTRQFQGWKKE